MVVNDCNAPCHSSPVSGCGGTEASLQSLDGCRGNRGKSPVGRLQTAQTRVNVPDERFDWLVDLHKPKSIVHPFLEVVDIAGLVKGASTGEGLGNAFLSHIKAVDGIIHVMRAFDDPDVIHVEDRVDPIGDIEIISSEVGPR
eukprot:53884-Prorocentrum_minimum.AAC.5